MPNSLSVGDLVKCRIWCSSLEGGGQASVNTIDYIVAAVGASAGTDADVATTLNNLIAVDYKSLLCNLTTYRGVQAQILNPTAPFRAKFMAAFDNSLAGVGNAGAAPLPPQTCGLLSFQTAFPGPAFRGRFYIAFPAVDSDSGGGTPNNTYITNANSLGATVGSGLGIITGGRTATLVRALIHGMNKAGVTPLPSPVLETTTSANWATQRRRGDFGRQNRSPI
jgi:hypothetical protein